MQWGTVAASIGGTGANKCVIFNNGGIFGWTTDFTFDYTTNTLAIGNNSASSGVLAPLFNATGAQGTGYMFQSPNIVMNTAGEISTKIVYQDTAYFAQVASPPNKTGFNTLYADNGAWTQLVSSATFAAPVLNSYGTLSGPLAGIAFQTNTRTMQIFSDGHAAFQYLLLTTPADTQIPYMAGTQLSGSANLTYSASLGQINVTNLGAQSGIIAQIFNSNATGTTMSFSCGGGAYGVRADGVGAFSSILKINGVFYTWPAATPAANLVLTTNDAAGTLKWAAGSGGSGGIPPGVNQQVIFNDGGLFGASANMVFDKVNSQLWTANVNSLSGVIARLFNSSAASGQTAFQCAGGTRGIDGDGNVSMSKIAGSGFASFNTGTGALLGKVNPTVPVEIAGTTAYNLLLSGLAPSMFFTNVSGVTPNGGAGVTCTAFFGFATANGHYSQSQGDLIIGTQSFVAGNSSAIKFMLANGNAGGYAQVACLLPTGQLGIGAGLNPVAVLEVKPSDTISGIKMGYLEIQSISNGYLNFLYNAYYNGSTWVYRTSSTAACLIQMYTNGVMYFYTAVAGTAGAGVPWNPTMNIGPGGVFSSIGFGSPLFNCSGPAGSYRIVQFTTGGAQRWLLSAGAGAESGGNAGSDFGMNRYADDGTYLGSPITISRATGVVSIPNLAASLSAPGGAGANTQVIYNASGAFASSANFTYNSVSSVLSIGPANTSGSGIISTVFNSSAVGGVPAFQCAGGALNITGDGRLTLLLGAFTQNLVNTWVTIGMPPGSYASANLTYGSMYYDNTYNCLVISCLTGGVAWRSIILGLGGGTVGVGIVPVYNFDVSGASAANQFVFKDVNNATAGRIWQLYSTADILYLYNYNGYCPLSISAPTSLVTATYGFISPNYNSTAVNNATAQAFQTNTGTFVVYGDGHVTCTKVYANQHCVSDPTDTGHTIDHAWMIDNVSGSGLLRFVNYANAVIMTLATVGGLATFNYPVQMNSNLTVAWYYYSSAAVQGTVFSATGGSGGTAFQMWSWLCLRHKLDKVVLDLLTYS